MPRSAYGAGSIPAGPPSAQTGIPRAPNEVAIARLPVYNFRPADGFPFDKFASIPMPTAGGPQTVVVRFTVPNGYNAIITAIANEFDASAFVDGDGSVVWAIAKNFVPGGIQYFPDYSAITVSLGLTKAPTPIQQLQAKEGNIIALLVTNVSSGLSGRTSGRILGFYYPVASRPSNTGF